MGVTTDEEFRSARERAGKQRERDAANLCPTCYGQGFILDGATPEPCACTLRAWRDNYLSRLPDCTFDRYETTDNVTAWRAAQLYAEHGLNRPWLVLAAPPGRGKTHLAVAILRHRACAEPPEMGVFRPAVELLDWFRAGMQPEASPDYETRISLACSWPLLVLDDLRAHRETPWSMDALERILDARHRADLETIITLETVIGLPERMVSRLLDRQKSCCMTLTGRDHRQNP